jgi:hypothetical protein
MQRIIFVKNNIVVSVLQTPLATLDMSPSTEFDFALPEPAGVFNKDDTFLKTRYLDAYPLVADPFLDACNENSIFSTTPLFNRSLFVEAGLQINMHPKHKSKYVYVIKEDIDMLEDLVAYGDAHGIKVPDYGLCDKSKNSDKFLAAGFTVLATQEVRARADIENFVPNRVMLKPSVACNNRAKEHPLTSALYLIRTKTELLALLDTLGAFSDPSILEQNPVVIQQVADGAGDNFDALILSGGINGAGDFWHFSPINLKTQYNDNERNAQTVWSPENNTAETQQLQAKIEFLLGGNTNCFYQLQFLRVGNAWVPHDFQYRMTYYVDMGLERTGNKQHKIDIIKFVFDMSTATFAQPVSIGLSLVAPHKGQKNMRFVSGADKAEVLAKLETL